MTTTFSGIFDTRVAIISFPNDGTAVGHYSGFTTTANPTTGNTIDGWQWDNRIWPGEDTDYDTTVPILLDADISEVDSDNFQSGVGSNHKDLEVIDIEEVVQSGFIPFWAPRIEHGYFYTQDKEDYLFADGVRTQYVLNSGVVTSGWNTITLDEFPKVGTPILSRTYQWNATTNQYDIYRDCRQKIYFTGRRPETGLARIASYTDTTNPVFNNIDTSEPEFIILSSGNNKPQLIFNGNYLTEVGHAVTTGNDLLDLELVGTSDGSNNQVFHLEFSPTEPYAPFQVYTFLSTSSYQLWTPVTRLTHTGYQVLVDRDLGIIQFGNASDGDQVPPNGYSIVIRYTTSVEVLYEPENTTDTVIPTNSIANINPIIRSSNRGFVIVKNQLPQPGMVTLYADLELLGNALYGPLNIGNNYAGIKAKVESTDGELIDNATVVFRINDSPAIGSFSNQSSEINGITNDLGIATVFYNPPKTVNDIGELVTGSAFSTTASSSILNTSNIKITGSEEEVFLYKVWKDDPIMGIDLGDQEQLDAGIITAGLDDYYRDFFIEEGIYGPTGLVHGTTTPTGSPLDLQTGASWWEQRHRLIQGLLTPANYNRLLRNGRKQIVSYFDQSAIDPHVTASGAFVPLQPTSIENISNRVNNVIFSGVILDTPSGELDGYLLISPTTVQLQAYVVNTVTNTAVYSNTIEVQLDIPSYMNGLVNIDDVNTIPSGIVPYVLSSVHNGRILPLGFRLRSSGVTLASALAGVTFIDINKQPILSNMFTVQKKG